MYGIISLITLLAGFNDLGMTESMNKFIPQFIKEKNYGRVKLLLATSITVQLVTSGIIFCIFFFGANYISVHFFKSEIAIEVLKIFSVFFIVWTTLILWPNPILLTKKPLTILLRLLFITLTFKMVSTSLLKRQRVMKMPFIKVFV